MAQFLSVWFLLSLVTAGAAAASLAGGHVNLWLHMENVPGGTACAARREGSEVDTMLMLNQEGHLILISGRADWHATGPEEISLRIDDFELAHLHASAFNNLVLLPIGDEAVLKRLMAAKDLYWSLPSGTYHAAVAGLGGALAWVRECERAKRVE